MSFQECKTDMCELSEPEATLNKKQLRSLQIAFHPDRESKLTPAQRERMAGRTSTQISQRVNECAPQFEDVNVSCVPPPAREGESRRRAFDLGRSEAERARAAAYYEHKEQARRNGERAEAWRAEERYREHEERRAEAERARTAEFDEETERRRQKARDERAEMERVEMVQKRARAEEARVRAAFAEEIAQEAAMKRAQEAARSPGVRRPARYTTSADIEDSGVRQFMDFLCQPSSQADRSTRGPRFG